MNKKKASYLDEMQEQKMLKIEHNAYHLFYWLLVGAILMQILFTETSPLQLVGECGVLFVVCVYVLAACLHNGIWERRLKPGLKTNLIASLLASLVMGLVWGLRSYWIYHSLKGSIALFILISLCIFVLIFLTLTLCCHVYKTRAAKLEQEQEEQEEQEP